MVRLPFTILLALLLAGCVIPQEGTVITEPVQNLTKPPVQNASTPQEQAPNITIPEPSPRLPDENFTLGDQTMNGSNNLSLSEMERSIFDKVNQQRMQNGIGPLEWDDDLAYAARLHSMYLAKENIPLTESSLFCKRPFIHHEGFDFGLYELDRLHNRSIYYFSHAGENLFVISAWESAMTYDKPQKCPENDSLAVEVFGTPDALEKVREGYRERLDFVGNASRVNWSVIRWMGMDKLGNEVVYGWMESEGHRANILDPTYTESGMGIARVNDYFIITQPFIKRVDCGYLGADCCLENETIFCYKPWYCQKGACY
ncbi:MAG: CAP domain-containing protein [Candidatus Micrarchaeota archaeon]